MVSHSRSSSSLSSLDGLSGHGIGLVAMLAALQRARPSDFGSDAWFAGEPRALVVLGELGTRFGTVLARLAATGATQRDKLIRRFADFQPLSLYSGGTREAHWDGGTLLRIRRLGVRIPPSAQKCWSQACCSTFDFWLGQIWHTSWHGPGIVGGFLPDRKPGSCSVPSTEPSQYAA
jgi:hypothetical protein